MAKFQAVNGSYIEGQQRQVEILEAEELAEAAEALVSSRYNAINRRDVSHRLSEPQGTATTQHQNVYIYVAGEMKEHWNVQIVI